MTEFSIDLKHGKLRHVGSFSTAIQDVRRDETLIVRTKVGTELAKALKCPEPAKPDAQFEGRVLRRATLEDVALSHKIELETKVGEGTFFREQTASLGLPMKLVDVEHIFGGERIIFYYVAPTRVDFRELLHVMLRQFRTQIEFRQLGPRDMTRVSGGCGPCGRPLCCSTFLKEGELGGVRYEMARPQFDTPEQAKLIGACGRLKCCLKYEYQSYMDSDHNLPQVGTRVTTEKGDGTVVARNLLLHIITIQKDGGERVAVGLKEIASK